MKIMASVPVTSLEGAVEDIKKTKALSALPILAGHQLILELRMDYYFAANPRLTTLPPEMKHFPYMDVPLAITVRPDWEGGQYKGKEFIRKKILQEAIDLNAVYVDVEGKVLDGELKTHAGYTGTSIIRSHHDFEKTPENLIEIYEKLRKGKPEPDVVKIATTAKNYGDGFRMLEAIDYAADPLAHRTPLIGLCMGELGSFTRTMGPVLGGEMAIVALDPERRTAAGQPTVEEWCKSWNIFNKPSQ
jgi:3-dehydroquinate dehydratase / shikimate dehydrogenase